LINDAINYKIMILFGIKPTIKWRERGRKGKERKGKERKGKERKEMRQIKWGNESKNASRDQRQIIPKNVINMKRITE